jgi:hypothetical protein
MKELRCRRVPFDTKDGEDMANTYNSHPHKFLPKSSMYTGVSHADLENIDLEQFEKLFGPGEDRPLEHSTWQVWRFKHNDTFFRVVIPLLKGFHSGVDIEAPEGTNKSASNPAVKKTVEEFILNLQADLA